MRVYSLFIYQQNIHDIHTYKHVHMYFMKYTKVNTNIHIHAYIHIYTDLSSTRFVQRVNRICISHSLDV